MSERTLIVVAEDDTDIAELLQMTLEWAGYRVVVTRNGEEALDAVASEAPELLVLDLNMPKLTGLDVVRRLRAEDRFRHTPMLLLTATESEQRAAEAADAGVTRYVVKPLAPKALVALVDEVLGRTR